MLLKIGVQELLKMCINPDVYTDVLVFDRSVVTTNTKPFPLFFYVNIVVLCSHLSSILVPNSLFHSHFTFFEKKVGRRLWIEHPESKNK